MPHLSKQHALCWVRSQLAGRQRNAGIQAQSVSDGPPLAAKDIAQDGSIQLCVPAPQVLHTAPWDAELQRF